MADGVTVARNALTAERAELQRQLAKVERALQALGGAAPAASERRGSHIGRVPRGSLTAGIEQILTGQSAPIHANEILDALRTNGAAPRGANAKASLVNALTRLAKQGKVRNTGRNHWRLDKSTPRRK